MLTNMGAQSECRRLALDLLQSQRSSISTGEAHGIVFVASGGSITGYRVVRGLEWNGTSYVTGGATVDVDAPRTFAQDLNVTATHAVLGYSFEGQAGGAYRVTLTGPHREHQIEVVPITGAITANSRFL